jgi:hypothetical protein
MVTLGKTEYRITLALGDLDALCAAKADKLGRQQRLQLVGAFMEPLGTPAVDARFASAFRHFSEQLADPAPPEATVEAALVTAVQNEILVVDGAAAGSPSQLPDPGKFVKIRLPGGFAIDSDKPLWYPVPHAHRFKAEKRYFDANPLLGALPIVARVEQRASPKAAWSAAPAGVKVHFQIVEPDALVAGAPSSGGALRAVTTVRGGGGPKSYIDAQYAAHPAQAGDPQTDNVITDLGGRRQPGAGIASDYFETAARKGFNSDLPDPFPVAAASSHPLAVAADTNAKGEAGVVFRPSRQGGDRFKLRAFLDPIGPGGAVSDGTDPAAVRADTGTMVVWRTLRVSGYHQFDYPAGIGAAAKATAGGALGNIDFAKVTEAYARAFVEITVERTDARKAHRIGDAFWVRAIDYARRNTPAQPKGTSQRYDIRALFPNANNTAGLVNMLLPGPYAAAKAAAFPAVPAAAATVSNDWQSLVEDFLTILMRYFTDNATPGLVIVQAPMGDSLVAAGIGNLTTSGIAVETRGCFLFYGSTTYAAGMPYNLEANTLHEMGHCMFLPHQWTDKIAATGAVSGGVPAEHDYKDYCIMSYQKNVRNFYDYCGRCNLKLRGWDTSTIPKNIA